MLLVDDEEAIRTIARATLERFGYRVMVAANGAQAVALYAQHRSDIAVVLTDMAMPVMDGPATIIALMSIDPAVKLCRSRTRRRRCSRRFATFCLTTRRRVRDDEAQIVTPRTFRSLPQT